MPEQSRGLEPILRERFRKRSARGKVECNLRFEANPAAKGELSINEGLAQQVINAANQAMTMTGEDSRLNPFQVMNWPGVMETPEQDMDAINKDLLEAFMMQSQNSLTSKAEGENMKALIVQRLDAITEEVVKVRARMPEIFRMANASVFYRLKMRRLNLKVLALSKSLSC